MQYFQEQEGIRRCSSHPCRMIIIQHANLLGPVNILKVLPFNHTFVLCLVFNTIYINKCQSSCQEAENIRMVQFKQAPFVYAFFIC